MGSEFQRLAAHHGFKGRGKRKPAAQAARPHHDVITHPHGFTIGTTDPERHRAIIEGAKPKPRKKAKAKPAKPAPKKKAATKKSAKKAAKKAAKKSAKKGAKKK